jgi:hypothetical protein
LTTAPDRAGSGNHQGLKLVSGFMVEYHFICRNFDANRAPIGRWVSENQAAQAV